MAYDDRRHSRRSSPNYESGGSTMRNKTSVLLLSVFLFALCSRTVHAEGTSASVTDKSGTKYALSDLKSDAKPPVSPLLPSSEHASLLRVGQAGQPLIYWVRMNQVSSVEKKDKETYLVTLRSKKTVTGSLSGNLTGKDDLGETKVSLDGDNIQAISMSQSPQKTATPSSSSKKVVYPGVISISDNSIPVSALAFSGDYTWRAKSLFKVTTFGRPVWETSREKKFITKIELIRGETTTVVDFAKIAKLAFSGKKDKNNRPQVTLLTKSGKKYQGSIDFEDLHSHSVNLVGNTDFGVVSIPVSLIDKLTHLNIEIRSSR